MKALRKPSTAAWLINQLVRRDAAAVANLLAVGAALREAQEMLSADELRAFTKQRRQLTAQVTTSARQIGRGLGTKVTEAVAEQIEATLTAAILDEGAGDGLTTGLLVTALRPAGVDDVDVDAALAVPSARTRGFTPSPTTEEPEAAPSAPVLSLVPDPDRVDAAIEAARARVEETNRAWEAASEELEELDEEVADLEARGMQAQARIEELRTRLAEATERQTRTEDQLADAEEARAEQRDIVEAARAERDGARARLDQLES